MSGPKKLFLTFASIFFLTIIYFMYDISTKTSFPGSKSYKEESVSGAENQMNDLKSDTTELDSLSNR
jgi:hypothetical protein